MYASMYIRHAHHHDSTIFLQIDFGRVKINCESCSELFQNKLNLLLTTLWILQIHNFWQCVLFCKIIFYSMYVEGNYVILNYIIRKFSVVSIEAGTLSGATILLIKNVERNPMYFI